jgi:hypothetical protein
LGDFAIPWVKEAAPTFFDVPKMKRYMAVIIVIAMACVGGFGLAVFAGEGDRGKATSLRIGSEFEVVGELYAHEVATDLNARKVDFVVLVPLRLSGPEILSRQLLPLGSRVRILAKTAAKWPSFLYPEKYFVEVSSLPKQATLPTVLGLSRGNEGSSTPLNPSIYKPIP